MSDTIIRPTFYEGEILPAADLVASLDSSRGQMARHARYLHQWGIATGLELQKTVTKDKNNKDFATIVLTAGMAVDGTGREIVVPEKVTLNPADFASQVNGKKGLSYPVFLAGRDEEAVSSSMLTGSCGASLPTTINENYDVTYGTPGSEQSLDEQATPAITDGPADGVVSDAWRILLGFVEWDPDRNVFTDAYDTRPDSGIGRRYVGVNAAQAVSRSGALQLATHPTGSPDAKTIMALEIHEANDGELVFGKQNAAGEVSPVLTVDSKGDLTITGKFSSAVRPGTIQVQSGIASDGVILPLPPGVASGDQADVHIHVTPRMIDYPTPAVPPLGVGQVWISMPLECSIDDSRRVNCRLRWIRMPATAASDLVEGPGLCDYTIIAAVAASGG